VKDWNGKQVLLGDGSTGRGGQVERAREGNKVDVLYILVWK
jgi:hypothetical protein